ncbi:SDR family NAD(P)-dependent oxidoreductase [Bacillus horti]|uniref:NAD(P)-dependent dehydrogenase (Short-subunit alcohol dehydrogenase family) n=1 Tax=Caldalkalibacillus horti TaxID=77523 RepID=A0ABT9W2H7_9BACI|nr:glucose 1-dehydrogenase [Bacillus horti]MDQ0167444.1 NAD(P)-dependent dehydrogenase (short-subunit alcohol dehydrogenase family) [Bacillus horti]
MQAKDQVVLITGASQGIGKELAIQYAKQGAKVVLFDLEVEQGQRVCDLIQGQQGKALFVQCDVSKEKDIQHAVEQAIEHFGQIDVLINNAGLSRWKNVYELKIEEWDHILNVNLRGAFLFSKEVAKRMKGNKQGGSIVNMASTRALMSEANSEAYAASKGGLVALTHALAVSLGPDRIRVNAISPGWIETKEYDQLRQIDHIQHPAQRVGKPSDIFKACQYLTNPENDFVTGTNVVVDGGMTRKMLYEH